MPGLLHVAPPELLAFAHRVDGLTDTAAGRTPAGALTSVAGALRESVLAEYASALAERMAITQRAVESDLGHIADNTRNATDVIVHTDAAAASGIRGAR